MCTAPGWSAQGTQGQKRLILDHAGEMHPQLRSGAGKKLVLEVGYGPAGEDEGDVTLCKVSELSRRRTTTPPAGTDDVFFFFLFLSLFPYSSSSPLALFLRCD